MIPVRYSGIYLQHHRYPFAVVNITNRCNLRCEHCFVFRDGNPNEEIKSVAEFSDDELLETMSMLQQRHDVRAFIWMGGEPLLRKPFLQRVVAKFDRNHVITNGTIPLIDLGPRALYVVSLDGAEEANDAIRGKGVYRRAMKNLAHLPQAFGTPIQVQCTVTRKNQHSLEELVVALRSTRVRWMTFTFLVPAAHDRTGNAWPSLQDRMVAVEEVRRLIRAYPGFVKNTEPALDLMAPGRAASVTSHCILKEAIIAFYLEKRGFATPSACCYGNDVCCELCGSWAVFQLAALRQTAEARPGSSRLRSYDDWLGSAGLV